MKQSQIDLLAVMAQFRKFSVKLVDNCNSSIHEHGMEKMQDVMGKTELVLEALMELHLEMFPSSMPPPDYHEVFCLLLSKKQA